MATHQRLRTIVSNKLNFEDEKTGGAQRVSLTTLLVGLLPRETVSYKERCALVTVSTDSHM